MSRPPRPNAPEVNWGGIPVQLTDKKRWVPWRYEWKGETSKWEKVPLDISNPKRRGDATDPKTWGSIEKARTLYEKGGRIDGVGFVANGDGLHGADLDGCYDPVTQELSDLASEALKRLDSYTEVTPSRKGIRIWIDAAKFSSARQKYPDLHVELYGDRRFLTVTGNSLNGDRIEERSAELSEWWDHIAQQDADEKLVRKGHREIHAFRALYDDGSTDDYDSRSEADLALCSFLAKLTDDREQIDRLFRGSALMREKWEREDYRNRTLDKVAEAEAQRSSLVQRLTPVDLSQRWDEDDEPEWVIEDLFLKGKYHEFVGEMGSGKSLALLGLIVTEAFPRKLRVAYLDEENGPEEVKRRLRALGASPQDVSKFFLYLPDVTPTIKEAEQAVKLLSGLDIDIACFDSLADFYVAAGFDEDSNKEATHWAKSYPEALAHDFGIATIGVDHFGHTDKNRARGASAKAAKADATWIVTVPEGKEFDAQTTGQIRFERGRKNRQGVLPESHLFKIGGDGSGNVIFRHLRDRAAEEEKKREVKQATEFKRAVLEVLEEAGQEGLSQTKLMKALRDAGHKGDNRKMHEKFNELARSPAGQIGLRQGGTKRIYYFRKQSRSRREAGQ